MIPEKEIEKALKGMAFLCVLLGIVVGGLAVAGIMWCLS